MRSYHIDVLAHAADADIKWVDNVLSRFDVPGVIGHGRGSARRISTTGINHVALTWRLVRRLELRADVGLRLARALLSQRDSSLDLGEGIELRFDRSGFLADMDRRIAEAVEIVVPARRGRPRRREPHRASP